MAGKRKRPAVSNNSPKTQLWSDKECAILYAYLDFGIKKLNYNKNDFLSTVGIRLKDAGSTRSELTKIVAKLKYDWEKFGRYGTHFEDLYKDGSCVITFDKKDIIKIAEAYRNFEAESSTIPTTRRLRGSTALARDSSIACSTAESLENGGRKTPAKGRPKIRLNKKLQIQQRTPLNIGRKSSKVRQVSSLSTTIAADSDNDDCIPRRSTKTSKLSPGNDNTSANAPSAVEVNRRCTSQCIFLASQPGIEPGYIRCKKCENWQHYTCVGFDSPSEAQKAVVDYLCNVCDPASWRERMNSHTSESTRHKIDTAIQEVMSLRKLLQETESDLEEHRKEIEKLEEKMLLQQSARVQMEKNHDHDHSCRKYEELIIDRSQHIKQLQRDLNDRHSLGTFTKLSPGCREWLGTKLGSETGISEVYNEIKQVALSLGSSTAFDSTIFGEYPQLCTLVRTSLTANGTEEDEQGLYRSSSKLNAQELLRTLTNSALLLWVFETDFPKLDNRSSELFKQYREILLKQDGATALRNIDLASHQAVINGPQFRKQTIPDEAEKLAIKLSRTLAPLFCKIPEGPEETSWDGFSTWGEGKEQWAKRRVRLVRLFELALSLKAQSCLNIENYEMMVYKPGTEFDKNTMTVETEEGMLDPRGRHEGRIVKVCVEAAVFSYARQGTTEKSTMADSIVSSTNFVSSKKANGQVVVKAVVVLNCIEEL